MKRNSPIGKGGNGKRGGSSKDMITKGLEAVAETVGRFTAKTFPGTTNAVDMLKADHAQVKQLPRRQPVENVHRPVGCEVERPGLRARRVEAQVTPRRQVRRLPFVPAVGTELRDLVPQSLLFPRARQRRQGQTDAVAADALGK